MKIKIVTVYSSRAEEYRLRRLRQRVFRSGIGILDMVLNVALAAGILLFVLGAAAADSENLVPVMWMLGIGMALTALVVAAKKLLGEY